MPGKTWLISPGMPPPETASMRPQRNAGENQESRQYVPDMDLLQ